MASWCCLLCYLRIMKLLPNLFTLANAAVGCLALYFISVIDFETATYCVLISCVFDFLDGFLARALGATSEFGKQLDSLADVISFGVVPGAVTTVMLGFLDVDFPWFFIGFIITLASAYRLANYNTSAQNNDHFSGLPTPANALLWIGLTHIETEITFNLIVGAVIVTSLLLNSSFAFYRLQLKFSLRSVVKILGLIVLMIVLWVQLGLLAWSIAITAYILFSLIYSLVAKSKG